MCLDDNCDEAAFHPKVMTRWNCAIVGAMKRLLDAYRQRLKHEMASLVRLSTIHARVSTKRKQRNGTRPLAQPYTTHRAGGESSK